MSFLWSGKQLKLSTVNKKVKPSPTNLKFYPDFAQSPIQIIRGRISRIFQKLRSIVRISLHTSLRWRAEAGMTVEAAVVLPLFLYFLLNLSCAIELIRLHGNLQLALWETCGKTAIYGYALCDSDLSPMFTGLYIKNQLVEYAGKNYLDNAPIKNGSNGLSLWGSDFFSDRDEMDVIVAYTASPWSSRASFTAFSMANRYFAHIWTGYEIPQNPQEAQKQFDVIYMTETGEVYHENRNCTHLKLSIREVTRAEAERAKNQWGSSYSPCEKCRPDTQARQLYITEEGNRYHLSPECPGLKRTVFSVPRSRAAGYRACSRCG